MTELKIQLDFLAGPIWKEVWDVKENREITGIPVIDSDAQLAVINDEIQSLYSSYYEFDSAVEVCVFNEDKEAADKETMLELLKKLRARIDELDDGTFTVVDYETPRIESL